MLSPNESYFYQDVHVLYEAGGHSDLNLVPVAHNRKFNHLDFLWGKDAKAEVYDPAIKLIKSLSICQESY